MRKSVRRTSSFRSKTSYIQVSTRKEALCLAKSKFDPPYIGSFEIVERLVQVASRMDLPVGTSRMRSTCHVADLMACLAESEWRAKIFKDENFGLWSLWRKKSVCEVCMCFGREAAIIMFIISSHHLIISWLKDPGNSISRIQSPWIRPFILLPCLDSAFGPCVCVWNRLLAPPPPPILESAYGLCENPIRLREALNSAFPP
ncbi:hypothetical protein OSB04_005091 [Centaurea solstitialis]|uniref:Tf2-1-like SH3-like domain-containing protein n=1 Tax=Centaurea solstitialis TaxID=347529 RepID=A0AA38TQX6_9ASTR|nr:hypothetical protein OSB04_005091 [Centaurea solstitialis]